MARNPDGIPEGNGFERAGTERPAEAAWPALPVAEWQATRDTVHLWTQMLGKVRLASTPLINHWWNIPLYVSARGLTTSLMPYGQERGFELSLDFVDHRLDVDTTDGAHETMELKSRPIADFYREFMAVLDHLGLSTPIWPMPVEIEGAIRFDEDTDHGAYEPEQAHRYWQSLVLADQVFKDFRSRFIGKASPVHLFWGALDLAATRFSGRTAPPHPGSAPNCGPHVMREAYSHEVSSGGYWPGGGGEGFFYSYAYPEPDGYREVSVLPEAAYYDQELGEFLLPYEVVRGARDPDALLMRFLQSTYEAAADQAAWDRAALERAQPVGGPEGE
jgi:hypothetical protein